MLKYKEGALVVWDSTDVDSVGPLDMVIVRVPDNNEYDFADVGQMYVIKYPNGGETWAFEDELSNQ